MREEDRSWCLLQPSAFRASSPSLFYASSDGPGRTQLSRPPSWQSGDALVQGLGICQRTCMSQALLGMEPGGNGIPPAGLRPQLVTSRHVRSVSFSEEAPCVKYIPGSAEQRGTNFRLALSGERPFCRPLKHKEGYFLLTAEVDGETRGSIFLGLQVRSPTCQGSIRCTEQTEEMVPSMHQVPSSPEHAGATETDACEPAQRLLISSEKQQ